MEHTEKQRVRIKDTRTIQPRLLDLKASALYLGRPVSSVRQLIWKGLPFIQEGRKMYCDVLDLNTYIEQVKTRKFNVI
jgi:hypothetical protein